MRFLFFFFTPILAFGFSQIKGHNCVQSGFLPKNDLYIPVHSKLNKSGVTEKDFNDVLDKVERLYSPIIQNYGGSLKIERLWQDGTVNASALRRGSTYVIKMYGGLARHHTITRDAFALVACHEIGHHIGGVPRYSNAGSTWASVEGQSDYFATTKCLKKLFENDDNETIISQMVIDPTAKQHCEQTHSNYQEQLLCQRIAMAGFSSASLFADSQNRNLPKFDTPDPSTVNTTYESHPEYQCRLDTYFQGALCTVDKNLEIGQNDPNVGTCNRVEQHPNGLRPLCWFKPQGGTPNPPPTPSPNPTPGPNPPSADIAATPNVNGQTTIVTNNPNLVIPISFNVSSHQNVFGMAIEISKANRRFQNPNGTLPDRFNGLKINSYPRSNGLYNFIPRNELPGYGNYQIRVIGLDRNQRPVSRFSDSFELNILR